jgi:RimJ/RimL family protein N-acetyltransferase
MTFMETERLRMDCWDPADVAGEIATFRRIATDSQVMRYINNGNPWTEARMREFVEKQVRQFAALRLCYWKLISKEANEFSGICGLQPLAETGEPEIGWWLAPPYWGKGLATEAAQAALRYGFAQPGIDHVVAVAVPENRASTHVMEKLGMTHEKDFMHYGYLHAFYSISKQAWVARRVET